ncbi:UTP--glucose-1-phosphate uridylyltransferase GalU [Thermanaerovibrio acidaminovorans]|uniref:UTP--glucose-1-phosphate uridylyltransferase n=1 Tax=Thermanaerovibrio acidaminovorans (strain ATCC 49978 / DSM 6589 / Su883) TaxID=525903 RepID=D1B9X0_THEAS|nr:UTP--glucose-1-phosphate uridylyltransferase GalU [Thermanaerovibrio acidaminovorans]ACZ19073.1 UTP-glucose-1-phosphate uridylyltransferase [Thermanaerovibrio acidaminovorans DSM 6589]
MGCSSAPLRHCLFPVAGLGTRFLPATKETPKEMLPLIDRPLIHYGVEEACGAGCRDVVFVTGRGKRSIEDYFDRSPDLEGLLETRGKLDLAEMVRGISEMARFSYVRQSEPLGLGHAVLCGRTCCNGDHFGVILPDDVILSHVPVLAQLDQVRLRFGGSVLALEEVSEEDTSRYGIVDAEDLGGGVFRIRDLVEKPDPKDAPSRLAIMGRYVLSSRIFDHLERVLPGSGGEIQLTDGLKSLLSEEPIYGYIYQGERLDCGTKEGWLKATVTMALRDRGLREIVMDVLRSEGVI